MSRAIMMIGSIYTLIFCPQAYSQATIAVGDTSWVKPSGNGMFILANPRDPQLAISRWSDDASLTLHPFRSLGSRNCSLYAIYGNPNGELFVAYTTSTAGVQKTFTIIGKVDAAEEAIAPLWRDDNLLPRSMAVGPAGAIYALGLTREQERKLRDLAAGEELSADILHIIEPRMGVVKSLLSVSINAASKTLIQRFLSRGSVVFRRNGNFLVSFDPVPARIGGFGDLLQAREFSPHGAVIAVHEDPGALKGSAVASIQVDRDDSLIIQYLSFAAQETQNSPRVVAIHRGQSEVIRIPADGGKSSRIMTNIPGNERIIGLLADGRIVTEIPEKHMIRLWQR